MESVRWVGGGGGLTYAVLEVMVEWETTAVEDSVRNIPPP